VIAIVMACAALFNKDVRRLEPINELVNVD
jgi:hypothetical protein